MIKSKKSDAEEDEFKGKSEIIETTNENAQNFLKN